MADELYGLPRDEFTKARDERAKRAKSEGERDLAAAIGRLRRPTVAAWLVNQLARQQPERLVELAELGEAMRGAHANLDGAELRRLSGRRRELIAELTGLTRELGEPVSESVGRELEDTFAAALTTPEAARALARGRLASPKELADADKAADPGAVTWPSATPGATPAPKPAAAPRPAERPKEPPAARPATPSSTLLRARAELDRTESAVADAEDRHAAAQRAHDDAAAEETAAHQKVADLRAELVAAERAERDARLRARTARRDREDTDRALREALRRRAVAQDRLAALEP